MSGPLYIQQGPSPNWWLSPAIWVTAQGDPSTGPKVANPIAGKPYTVWVEVQNLYLEPYSGGWNLFVCWGIPFTGTLPSVNIGQILNGSMTSAGPQGAPIAAGTIPAATASSPGIAVLKAATTWIPSLENGGHECLLAAVYDEQAIGGLATSALLDGDAAWTQVDSVAQHNLSVVRSTGGMRHFPYHFEVWNNADQARDFEVVAWQAPLKGIEAFLPGVQGGKTVLERPSKVDRLGIVAGAKADAAELEKAPSHAAVKIPPRSSHPFALGISLSKGNALIHVTQSQDRRIVGGLSVLAMAEAK
jgi:hypothetical protein